MRAGLIHEARGREPGDDAYVYEPRLGLSMRGTTGASTHVKRW